MKQYLSNLNVRLLLRDLVKKSIQFGGSEVALKMSSLRKPSDDFDNVSTQWLDGMSLAEVFAW